MSEHDQFRELIEGYALGALDANERAALEAHLASGCPECAKALEEARLVVSQLAYLAPPAQPSAVGELPFAVMEPSTSSVPVTLICTMPPPAD